MAQMNRTGLFQILKSLVEGEIEAGDWLKWWEKNRGEAASILGKAVASRLAPNCPGSPAGAANQGQNEAV